jgi:hypothetical protein
MKGVLTPSQVARAKAEADALRAARGEVFEVTIGRRKFKRGDELTITGQGKTIFKFICARVIDGRCEWIQVAGGKRNSNVRHFAPERIASKKRVQRGERM